jgi:peptide methionine sulfoxide reductase msrA/msrB
MKYNKLTPEEESVILHKGTEMPFAGKYYKSTEAGTYCCKQCNSPLYRSEDKFSSECGWPSFDDEIKGAVKRTIDRDGRRTEISCAKCGAHLGHVFIGEGFTPKSIRHCVNSISLSFVSEKSEIMTSKAIFAGGCFWGVEFYLAKEPGVISTQVGYIGGHTQNPSYKEVCGHGTGHFEAVEVIFDPSKTSFYNLCKLFFEIHDFTQTDGQGPDIGEQYLSAIFYFDDDQQNEAIEIIKILKSKNFNVATKIISATKFWPAEDYHQNYYELKSTKPYCHRRKMIF